MYMHVAHNIWAILGGGQIFLMSNSLCDAMKGPNTEPKFAHQKCTGCRKLLVTIQNEYNIVIGEDCSHW